MYVSVLDADGAPVAELTVEDFTVREDGLLREVLRVSPATDPMQVALLVDNSVAMSPYLRDLRNGLESFVEQLAGDHEVAVITFGDRPTIVVDYTRSLIELRQAIGRIFPRPGSGALLLDAIYNAGQGLQRRQAARPVFVVVTTEGVEYSNRPYQMVLRTIEDAGATFHAVVMTHERFLVRHRQLFPRPRPRSGDRADRRPTNRPVTRPAVSGDHGGDRPPSCSLSTCWSTPVPRCWCRRSGSSWGRRAIRSRQEGRPVREAP